MADLKGVLTSFAQQMFGLERKVRFRCDYFPFVEPGVEVDIKMPGGSKWLEVMGAGMVHPDVLARVDINPKLYSGFAFGLGVERIPMLRYGIDDIRLFYSNDLRFLRQF
jgi:phenylalanyl-tRNA synthetase alpha chain